MWACLCHTPFFKKDSWDHTYLFKSKHVNVILYVALSHCF